MGAPDLKLKVVIDSKELGQFPDKMAKLRDKVAQDQLRAAEKSAKELAALQRNSITADETLRSKNAANYEKWWERTLATVDKGEKARVALQRNSITLEEQMERKRAADMERNSRQSLQLTSSRAEAALRIERQAALAESSLVLDKFDRRIAVERKKHAQILADLKGNDAAQEAEVRRHNAVVSRISMDKANLPNTPFQQLLGGMSRGAGFQDGVAGIAAMAGGAIGATVAFSALKSAISSTMDAAMQVQSIKQALSFVAGSAEQGAKEFQFLTDESMRLGLSIKAVAPDFGLLAAAAKDTKMQGQGVRELFTGMAEASTVLHLSAEQTSGAINAFQQMLSKGKVQAQEMNLQLGNALPGSLNIAAKAMGVTKEQFVKMMGEGQIFADEFLPKMAAELHKTFGEAAVTASDNARQSIQKFNNSMFQSASVVGEVFVEAAGKGAKAYLSIASSVNTAAAAQQNYYANLTASLSPEIIEQAKKENAVRAEGLRLAKEAKSAEDQKNGGPSQGQSDALEKMKKEDEKAAKFGIELKKEFERTQIEATEDGVKKEIALAELKYKENFAKSEGYYKNEKAALALFNQEKAKIYRDAEIKEANEHRAQLREDEKKKQELLVDSNEKAMAALAELKKKNGAGDLAVDRSGPGGVDKLAAKQKDLESERILELNALKDKYGDTEAYDELVFELNREYANKNKLLLDEQESLEKKAHNAKFKTADSTLNNLMGLYKKHGAAYKIFAEAKNAVDTAEGAMAAWAGAQDIPYPGNLIAGGIAVAADVAMGIKTAGEIAGAKFYEGGYTGAGDPHSVAGIVHRDEYVVPHDTLARAGGPAGVERMINGSGTGNSFEHSGPVHINVTMPAGTSQQDAWQAGAMAGQAWLNFMRNVKRANAEIPNRRIPEYS